MTSFWRHPFACTKKDGVFRVAFVFPMTHTVRRQTEENREADLTYSPLLGSLQMMSSNPTLRGSFFLTLLFTLGYSWLLL